LWPVRRQQWLTRCCRTGDEAACIMGQVLGIDGGLAMM